MAWIEPSSERYQEYLRITNDIKARMKLISDDTGASSSTSAILKHKEFYSLVQMGTRIIPFLINDLTQHGCSWLHLMLLRELSGVSPIRFQGNFLTSIADWINWYVESPYYKQDNIYHGLVS